MSSGEIPGPGSVPPSRPQGASEARSPLSKIVRHDLIDRIANDGGDRDAAPSCLRSEASHLVLGERDLGPQHRPKMITERVP
jgi:hypothetical protein